MLRKVTPAVMGELAAGGTGGQRKTRNGWVVQKMEMHTKAGSREGQVGVGVGVQGMVHFHHPQGRPPGSATL